jgi:hypothetical protein
MLVDVHVELPAAKLREVLRFRLKAVIQRGHGSHQMPLNFLVVPTADEIASVCLGGPRVARRCAINRAPRA